MWGIVPHPRMKPNVLKIGIDSDGKVFSLPLETVTATIAILAIKGKGKTYLSDVFNEELMDAGQVPVIIDYTGAHWGLKSSADGKSAGFPVVVFGGEHADLPLEEHAGEVIARAVVEQRFPAILDLSLLRKGPANRFLGDFMEALYRLNRQPIQLVCDEADAYAPQKPFGDQARTLGAIEDIVRRGRIRGIGCTLITQRPSVINKNVLTQCEMLVALGMGHPRDIDAIKEWVNVHGDPKTADAMIASLPALPQGTAWFWAPGWDLFKRVKIRARHTFDSSATPKPGESVRRPQMQAEIDIQKLGSEIAATAQRAKENDPKVLKQEIQRLKIELAKTPTIVPPAPKTVEVPVLTNEQVRLIQAGIGAIGLLRSEIAKFDGVVTELRTDFNNLAGIVAKSSRTIPVTVGSTAALRREPTASRPARAAPFSPNGELDPGRQKILDTIAMLKVRGVIPSRDSVARWHRVSNRNGLHPTGGTYGQNLAALRAEGYLENCELTDKGSAAAREIESGFDAACATVDAGQERILRVLQEHPSKSFTRDTLAEALDLHPTGGTYGQNLARLRTMQLIPDRGEIRLLETADR